MANDSSLTAGAQLVRVGTGAGVPITFFLNDQCLTAYEGDTVLTAVLTSATYLRRSEFLDLPRAGFCLMGACQDCWIQSAGGQRVRACSTMIAPGMAFVVPTKGGCDE